MFDAAQLETILRDQEDKKKRGEQMTVALKVFSGVQEQWEKGAHATVLLDQFFPPKKAATYSVSTVNWQEVQMSTKVLSRRRVFLTGRIAQIYTCAYVDKCLDQSKEAAIEAVERLYPIEPLHLDSDSSTSSEEEAKQDSGADALDDGNKTNSEGEAPAAGAGF